MGIEQWTALAMLIALIAYVLLGGADFGGGVWDLLAFGKTREQQRETIEDAIGPIWEANHIWLIVLVVLMFTGFPPAFAALTTALHVPLTIMLIGIVLRGAAFTFRHYDQPGAARDRWGIVFSAASLLTPMLLGVTLGTAASGALEWNNEGVYVSGFFEPWLRPFPWLVGGFTLCIFALLAAVYLCVEIEDDVLRAVFRKRAMGAEGAVIVMGVVTWIAALLSARELAHGLSSDWWSWPLRGMTALAALTTIALLIMRRFVLARAAVVLQATLIVGGFGLAMQPYLIVPQVTIEASAAPPLTHKLLLGALALGSVILLPSLWYLFRVFKGKRAFAILGE